jgi:hypothetical protein
MKIDFKTTAHQDEMASKLVSLAALQQFQAIGAGHHKIHRNDGWLPGAEHFFEGGAIVQSHDRKAKTLTVRLQFEGKRPVKLDRLARSTSDLYAIIGKLREKGVGFRCLDNQIDTTTKHGKLLLGVLAIIAEFEADIRHERQMEGIAKAKANGIKFGRQARLSPDDIAQMKARRKKGALIKDLQRDYKLSKAHVYRLLAA